MSYKSLLFCPDEKTARLVTQVLSELEFTVELANEPFAAVKKASDEHFDALVADIDNEQDAALLFKSARNSNLNHSSLSVAVVEGQAGVAKAFRIGANLVLTKPINIEQSKGTLRVARGLLRKSEAKSSARPAGAAAKVAPSSAPGTHLETKPPVVMAIPSAPAHTIAAPAASTTEDSFSMLEVEKEPTPAPEPSEVALIESMPDPIAGKAATVEHSWAPALKSSAEPIAASTASSAAAAVAPALEKPVVEIKTAAPLATHEPITADDGRKESFEPAAVPVPSFSYGQESGRGEKKIFKSAAILVLLGAAGYVGWQRLELGRYLPNLRGSAHSTESQPVKPSEETDAPPARGTAPASQALVPVESFPSATTPTEEPKVDTSVPRAEHFSQPENIQVEELSSSPEPKITVVPKPLVVKAKPANQVGAQKPTQVAAPALAISPSNSSTETLANIVPTTSNVPTPALAPLRISQGVSQGLVIKKVAPIYPSSALQLRRQGSVELLATIGKDGVISGIKVLSGDAVFAKAATDAVRQWKYRPYLLNGEPVQIETQITINFHLPN